MVLPVTIHGGIILTPGTGSHRGCSSVVERHVANVNVGRSNRLTRFDESALPEPGGAFSLAEREPWFTPDSHPDAPDRTATGAEESGQGRNGRRKQCRDLTGNRGWVLYVDELTRVGVVADKACPRVGLGGELNDITIGRLNREPRTWQPTLVDVEADFNGR